MKLAYFKGNVNGSHGDFILYNERMITPELLTFIQGQLAAGTSREQVADMLLSNGWSAADITNALSQAAPVQPVQPTQPVEPARPVEPVQSMQPMQAAAIQPVQTYTEPVYRPVAQSSLQPMQSVQSMQPESAHLAQAQTQTTVSHSGWTKSFMVLAGIVVAFAAGWIANQGVTNSRMQTQSVRDAASNQPSPAVQDQVSENGSTPAGDTVVPADSASPLGVPASGAIEGPALAAEKDCGTTNGKTPYASDPVLACMGAAALSCGSARATVSVGSGGSAQPSTSALKITNPGSGGSCSFTVVPAPAPAASGASASAPSISCPLSIVKASDDFLSSATPTWKNPTKTDPNKYAGEIYYYGAMGVFIQNNFSEAKIRALGCTGDFIKTYIAEHAKSLKMLKAQAH